MARCPYCMRPAQQTVCTHCGKPVSIPSDPHQLPAGFVISGGSGQSYELGAVLGQGGFGITYVGLDCTLERRVAIKEYFPARCAQRLGGYRVGPKQGAEGLFRGGLHSFLQEARMLASLEDIPSVVRVRSFFEFGGTAYLVMEYLDGKSMYQIIKQRGPIPAQELLPKLDPLLHDLERLHQAGVIHRDISPDNIMWMPDGTLKLMDFGCARSMEDGKSMTVALKPGFAPVEQYQTRGQGPYTDVYALSATIYYAFTGVIPPSSPDRLEEDTLQPPTAFGAQLSKEQEEALLWGMTVQPKFRPVNVDVFLQRFLTAPPIPEPEPEPQSWLEKVKVWLQKLLHQ